MMKKKFFGMMTVFVAVMLVFGLAGCGSDSTDDNEKKETGGNPVLATGEIWVDDQIAQRGILFDGNTNGGNVYEYWLAYGTWGGGLKAGVWSNDTITYDVVGFAYTFSVSGDKLYEYYSGNTVATYTKKTGQTIGSQNNNNNNNGGGLPPAATLTEYGLDNFTLPAGVTATSWDEYNNNQLYIDVDSATDPRPAIGALLLADGWTGSGNYFTKPGLTLRLNEETGTWYSIEVNK
ncbi:MAG: hypothetical protein FWH53_09655 [Leptospirales bacterium]|nr:hypothetical protein [Leptospirales bacterium]